jgi:hypothetical protein
VAAHDWAAGASAAHMDLGASQVPNGLAAARTMHRNSAAGTALTG